MRQCWQIRMLQARMVCGGMWPDTASMVVFRSPARCEVPGPSRPGAGIGRRKVRCRVRVYRPGMVQTLADVLDGAARGRFPPADGGVTVVPQPSRRDAGVIAFTAHSVVFIDEDPRWVRKALASCDCDPLAAALNPRFLTALMD